MFVRLVLLGIALLAAFLVALVLTRLMGWDLAACERGFVIVFCCSMGAIAIGEFPRGDEFAILRLGSSIFLRSGLVLVSLMLLSSQEGSGRALLDNGIIQYILAFYAVGLVVDVWLTCLRLSGSAGFAQESYSSQPEL